MGYSKQGRLRQQIGFLRRQFVQEGDLPFTNVLSQQIVLEALTAAKITWNDSIYQPLVTLWIFLSQVLSEDHSCRSAVARLIAHRLARGESACSPETGAYCTARKRLPEKFFTDVTCRTGRTLDAQTRDQWNWKGRHVYMFDGTTVSMPDTPANQRAYPQPDTQKPGLGFPMARIGTITSLACGAILNLSFCKYAGKGQSEVGLLRSMWDILSPGDVLLTDCLMSTWTEMVLLKQRGVDSVSRLNRACRRADFRRGKHLGCEDHVVCWPKPSRKPDTIDRRTFNALPAFLEVRELRVQVKQRVFHTKTLVVVTTLCDPETYAKSDLAELFRARWNHELDYKKHQNGHAHGCLALQIPGTRSQGSLDAHLGL